METVLCIVHLWYDKLLHHITHSAVSAVVVVVVVGVVDIIVLVVRVVIAVSPIEAGCINARNYVK